MRRGGWTARDADWKGLWSATALSLGFVALILAAEFPAPPSPFSKRAVLFLLVGWGAALGLLGRFARPGWRVRAGALVALMLVAILLNSRWVEQNRTGIVSAPLLVPEGPDLLSLARIGGHKLVLERSLYLALERFIEGRPLRYGRSDSVRPEQLLALAGAAWVTEIPQPSWLPGLKYFSNHYPLVGVPIIRQANPALKIEPAAFYLVGVDEGRADADAFVLIDRQALFFVMPEAVFEAERARAAAKRFASREVPQ